MPVSGEEESACDVYHVGAGGNVNSLGETGDGIAILTSYHQKYQFEKLHKRYIQLSIKTESNT